MAEEGEELLREAEVALEQADQKRRDAEADCERKKLAVEEARAAVVPPGARRRLLTAYALWAFTPLIWPGGYLFYLGRDTECWLHTITFGGFGVGWFADALFIPAYVADCNEAPGAQQRYGSYLSMPTLFAPLRLMLQLLCGLWVGMVTANLVSSRWLESLLGAEATEVCRLCFGLAGVAIAIWMSCTMLGRTRARCHPGRVVSWMVGTMALSLGSGDNWKTLGTDGIMPQLVIGAAGALAGAVHGRHFAANRAPRRNLAKLTRRRLLTQMLLVGLAAGSATGAFYLNGSITLTDDDGGKKTYSGPEAISLFAENVAKLGSDIGDLGSQLYNQNKHKSFYEMLADLKALFADPAKEAAEVLGVDASASESAIKKAYRDLARQHHPDKQGAGDDETRARAEQAMQRVNWAKEVLLSKSR